MKTAILFAGQGAQYVGMGKDFYEEYEECREVYDNANVDFSLQNLCFEGPKEMLDNTAFAQSCILTTSIAISALLKKNIHLTSLKFLLFTTIQELSLMRISSTFLQSRLRAA